MLLILFFLFLARTSQPLFADEAVVLSPIVVEGSAADALLYDPILPSRDAPTRRQSSSGSIGRDFSEELPIPVTDYQTPGTTSQIRGIGRTADDTNVQTLGVPLNPAPGGGFDLSTFPQFFWSGYRFQFGPSSGGYDPRAGTATLTLIPWTADALDQNRNSYRLTQWMTRGLSQTSVAAHDSWLAALVGVSAFNAQGPTGSLSAQVLKKDQWTARAHLLATSIEQTSPGSISFPTPQAKLTSKRWIPVLEAGFSPRSDLVMKETLFYDRSSVRFVNPEAASLDSYDRSAQFGSESALLVGDWKFGLSAHRASFEQLSFSAPSDWVTRLEAARIARFGASTLSASAEGDYLSGTGWKPGASLGARYDFGDSLDIFAKGSFTYRFPSVLDRYYNLFGFVPNPGLMPERSFLINPGAEWRGQGWSSILQAVLQFRSDAQVTVYDPASGTAQVQNQGGVQMESLLHELTFRLRRNLDVMNSLRVGYSKIDRLGQAVPYNPLLTEVLRGEIHASGEVPRWRAGIAARAVTRSAVAAGVQNPGYVWFDFDAGYRIGDFFVDGRIDNLAGRPIEVINGYPSPGRLYSLSLVAAL